MGHLLVQTVNPGLVTWSTLSNQYFVEFVGFNLRCQFSNPQKSLKRRSTKMSAFSATRDESLDPLQQAQTLYGRYASVGVISGANGAAYIFRTESVWVAP